MFLAFISLSDRALAPSRSPSCMMNFNCAVRCASFSLDFRKIFAFALAFACGCDNASSATDVLRLHGVTGVGGDGGDGEDIGDSVEAGRSYGALPASVLLLIVVAWRDGMDAEDSPTSDPSWKRSGNNFDVPIPW
jgi:hypothetical protein